MAKSHAQSGDDMPTLVAQLLAVTPHRRSPLVVSRESIVAAGRAMGIEWPNAYIEFLMLINGVEFDLFDCYRVVPPGCPEFQFRSIVYQNEWLRLERGLPNWFVSFYTNGTGDEDGFALKEDELAKVLRWRHDAESEEEKITRVSDGFYEWLLEEVRDRQ